VNKLKHFESKNQLNLFRPYVETLPIVIVHVKHRSFLFHEKKLARGDQEAIR
jgi:hypothetical protein